MYDEVLELITQQLTEIRLNVIVHENEDYKQAEKKEMDLYKRFVENLSLWQKDEFEKFLAASSESNLMFVKLSYQQGMKDLMALLKSLEK